MINIRRHFKKFQTDDLDQMREYEGIINNPLCTVVEKVLEKEKDQEYNDRGNLIRQREIVYFLVHWEERCV